MTAHYAMPSKNCALLWSVSRLVVRILSSLSKILLTAMPMSEAARLSLTVFRIELSTMCPQTNSSALELPGMLLNPGVHIKRTLYCHAILLKYSPHLLTVSEFIIFIISETDSRLVCSIRLSITVSTAKKDAAVVW